ncbi:MAG: hypothetical protein WAL04_04460 [Acidimicrobiales bacterium]
MTSAASQEPPAAAAVAARVAGLILGYDASPSPLTECEPPPG